MHRIKITLSLLTCLFIVNACGQQDEEILNEVQVQETTTDQANKHDEQHPYGGWFCPDNLYGFPPMHLDALDEIPVINGRLPNKEESMDGSSLLFIDTAEYKNARALNMDMPRLARIHSSHNDLDEIVVVIQAIAVGNDSVVGFRYPHGGNGSAWFNEVTFLSEAESESLEAKKMVYLTKEVTDDRVKIWNAITSTSYGEKLKEVVEHKEFLEQEWNDESSQHINYEMDGKTATGIIANFWGNLYVHIDYTEAGRMYTEKLVVMNNRETQKTDLHWIAGPFGDDFEEKQTYWKNWLSEIEDALN